MKLNLVSVIILTYNRAALVKESIASVLAQTYSHLELIVVDDGSTDDTEEVIKKFKDDRIRYFKFDHSGYTGKMKNFAIQHAKGEYVAFNDSDDNWKPDKLEKQLRLFESCSGIGFSITDVITYSEEAILIGHSYHSDKSFECRSIFNWLRDSRFLVYNPTVVLKKECFLKTGPFNEEMVSGDFHFNLRLAYHFSAGIIYEPLVWRRVHNSNMSNQFIFENYDEYVATFELLFRNKWIGKKHLRVARSIASFKKAGVLAKRGELAAARREYLGSIKQRWFHSPSYIALLKTFFRSQHVNN
jgi:glycosyltransferase involved in cell wall biosynthesis